MWETEMERKCLTCQTLIFLSSQLLIFLTSFFGTVDNILGEK